MGHPVSLTEDILLLSYITIGASVQVFFCQEAVRACVRAAEGLVPRAPDLGVRRAVGGGLVAVGAAVVTLAPHAGQGQRGAGGRRVLAEVRRGHGVTRARGGRGHGRLATLGIVTGGRRGHGGGSCIRS